MEQKSTFLILSIVAIVAIVSLVLLKAPSRTNMISVPQEDVTGQGNLVANSFVPGYHSTEYYEYGPYSYCEETHVSTSEKTSKNGCTQITTKTTTTIKCYENKILVSTLTSDTTAILCSPKDCGKETEIEDKQGQTYRGHLRTSSSTTMTATGEGGTSSSETINHNQIQDSTSGAWVTQSGTPPDVELNSCF
ncbi:hypothetical protein J4410_04550 [Candidatus Woesearchaeota archaeon]|nr:hypothetical protein [Candidatus Woesearchaeota archaeon]